MIRLKKLLSLFFVAVLIVSLSGCSTKQNQESQSQKAPDSREKITVVLDWVPNTNHTGLYVAKDKGYFAEEGLDVDIIQPSQAGAAQLIASQQGDFGVSYQEEVTNARAIGIPITSIAAVIQHNTSGFASPKPKNIKTPKDFEGKKYGGWGSPMEHAMLASLMEKYGADIKKVEEVNIGTSDFFTSVQKDVDFSWIYYGWDGIQAELKNIPLNIIILKEEDPALDYYTPVLIASEKTISERPETVKKFLKAVSRGYGFAISHPDESADILLANAPELNAELAKASQRWLADKYQGDAPAWGVQKLEVWQRYGDWMFSHKLLEKKIDYRQAFTNDFLPQKE
nr:ABC transporter substrate-binding protein [Candidatus Formimonas warabiya]